MRSEEVRRRLDDAAGRLLRRDWYLIENDLSERCIAARLALHLQELFPDHDVDVEYNRDGATPKRLNLPEQCANARGSNGDALVVPDVVVHTRGRSGPNLLAIELKKASNPTGLGCDRLRVTAMRQQLGYQCAALVQCDASATLGVGIEVVEWLAD